MQTPWMKAGSSWLDKQPGRPRRGTAARLRHRGAGTTPRPTPAPAAIHAAGNEPHWETGRRTSPTRAAGGQPGDGDDSRAAPLLPTGTRCEHHEPAPSPPALLGSATATAFVTSGVWGGGGRGQCQITAPPPTGSPPDGTAERQPRVTGSTRAPAAGSAPPETPTGLFATTQPGHPRATSPRHRWPRLPRRHPAQAAAT